MSSNDYAKLQAVLDQLVALECNRRGSKNGDGILHPLNLGKTVLVSSAETNDIHVDVHRVLIHPFFLTLGHAGNPLAVVARAIDLALEFDAERQRRTQHAVNDLRWQLRTNLRRLYELDPDSISGIIQEFYDDLAKLSDEDDSPLNLEVTNG